VIDARAGWSTPTRRRPSCLPKWRTREIRIRGQDLHALGRRRHRRPEPARPGPAASPGARSQQAHRPLPLRARRGPRRSRSRHRKRLL
jgi:hypothetical protein